MIYVTENNHPTENIKVVSTVSRGVHKSGIQKGEELLSLSVTHREDSSETINSTIIGAVKVIKFEYIVEAYVANQGCEPR